ncbi:hypothetical protein Tco_1372503 [Tanacetum coccineum]
MEVWILICTRGIGFMLKIKAWVGWVGWSGGCGGGEENGGEVRSLVADRVIVEVKVGVAVCGCRWVGGICETDFFGVCEVSDATVKNFVGEVDGIKGLEPWGMWNIKCIGRVRHGAGMEGT